MTTKRTTLAALTLAAALLWAPGPARAQAGDLSGAYAITGTDPGGTAPYHGSAVLTRQGAAYLFEAEIDGVHYAGLGLHDPQAGVLALSFLEDDDARSLGVTVLRVEDTALRGSWVARGQVQGAPGSEAWTRR